MIEGVVVHYLNRSSQWSNITHNVHIVLGGPDKVEVKGNSSGSATSKGTLWTYTCPSSYLLKGIREKAFADTCRADSAARRKCQNSYLFYLSTLFLSDLYIIHSVILVRIPTGKSDSQNLFLILQ